MIKIIYPDRKPLIKNDAGREYIFCMIRKRWFIITPEEWVRQNFLLYLTEILHYPASLIAVEKQLVLHDVKKRFDIVVYDKKTKPFLIVECKEMNVLLTESTLQQVLRYNINVKAKYVVITNGMYCEAFLHDTNKFVAVQNIPNKKDWKE